MRFSPGFPFPSNPFGRGGGGIGSFLTPLIDKIGMTYQSQTNDDLQQRLDNYKQQVEQLTTDTFPEVSFDGQMGGRNPFRGSEINKGFGIRSFQPLVEPQLMDSVSRPSAPQRDFGSLDYSTVDYSNQPQGTASSNQTAFSHLAKGLAPSSGLHFFGNLMNKPRM